MSQSIINAGVKPLRRYGKRALKMIVSKWLRTNAKMMGDEMTREQSDNMYEIYKKDCDFHSPRIIYGVDGIAMTLGFRICIGEATLRGSKRYKMPSMSLDFQVGRQSALLFTDIERYLKGYISIENIQKHSKWLGLCRDTSGGRQVLSSEIGIHPHVSPEGSPCLGDFGQPWSVCLNQGNLPMMVSVAKSFQNNWTRNDAYWDINYVYRNWEDNKYLSFKEQICFMKLAQAITYAREDARTSYRSLSEYALTDFIKGIEHSKIKSLGWSRRQILMYWACASIATEKKRDLPDGALSKNNNELYSHCTIIDSLKRIVKNKLNCNNAVRLTGVLDAALVKIYDDAYTFNASEHKCVFNGESYTWTRTSFEDLRHRLQRFEQSRRSASDNKANALSVIKAKSEFIKDRWLVLREYSDINDIIYDLGQAYVYTSRESTNNHYRTHMWILMCQRFARHCRNIRKDDFEYSTYLPEHLRNLIFDWHEFQKYAHTSYKVWDEDETKWQTMEMFNQPYNTAELNIGALLFGMIDTVRLNNEVTLWGGGNTTHYNKLLAEMQTDVLEDVKSQFKSKTRSIINERDKTARVAYGTRSQSDSGENQLSIEAF